MNAPAGTRNQAVLLVTGGLAVGSLTSFGQTYLHGALAAFVNSASAWLIAPFFLGAYRASWRAAAVVGLGACLLQLGGYYLTAQLRGFPAGGAILVLWAGCAVLGGPAYGAAGWLWRTGGPRVRGLGAAVLASAFLAEGLWVYLHELRRYATAALWITIGTMLAATMARRVTEARWLALTVPIALAGEVLLTQVYSRAF
jgi:hypothetical protein